MYKYKKPQRTQIKGRPTVEGERIEIKVARMLKNKEPIKDGAPLIFTERKDGVVRGYNIRTDRWEVATEAMDKVAKSIQAKREGKFDNKTKDDEGKIVDINDGKNAEPTHGKTGEDSQSK